MSRALKSMTGFARAAAENEAYSVAVEIRSVNHRYLEVRLRGAAGLASYEKSVRDRVAAVLGRGKVDVNVHLKPKAESAYEIEVDRPLMRDYAAALQGLASDLGLEGELTVSDLAAFGPAFQVRERSFEGSEKASLVGEVLDEAVKEALVSFQAMSEAEGAELLADLDARLHTLGERLDAIEARSRESREARRGQLQTKVAEIVRSALEPGAAAMEIARLVERSDITEEITRFRSHVTLWQGALEAEGPCGKKLDFIVQEMNREVNTMGSKCQDAAIAEHVIAMKAELERVREQVQNIE